MAAAVRVCLTTGRINTTGMDRIRQSSAVLLEPWASIPSNNPRLPSRMESLALDAMDGEKPFDRLLRHQPSIQVVAGGTGSLGQPGAASM